MQILRQHYRAVEGDVYGLPSVIWNPNHTLLAFRGNPVPIQTLIQWVHTMLSRNTTPPVGIRIISQTLLNLLPGACFPVPNRFRSTVLRSKKASAISFSAFCLRIQHNFSMLGLRQITTSMNDVCAFVRAVCLFLEFLYIYIGTAVLFKTGFNHRSGRAERNQQYGQAILMIYGPRPKLLTNGLSICCTKISAMSSRTDSLQ